MPVQVDFEQPTTPDGGLVGGGCTVAQPVLLLPVRMTASFRPPDRCLSLPLATVLVST